MTGELSHNGSMELNQKPRSNASNLSESQQVELSRLVGSLWDPFELALRLPLRLSMLRHLEGDES